MTKLLALLLLVACKDDRAPDPRVLALGGAPHAAVPTGTFVGCDKLVAPTITDRYLSSFTLDERKLSSNSTRCRYRRQSATIDLMFHCSDLMVATLPTVRAMFKNAEELPGIGRSAYRVTGGVIQFWDDDTNCMVTIGAFGTGTPKDLPQFARDLAASITPASIE